ncbi:MAG: hypothetical protein Q7T63_04975, partial [Burkholderiaceae bacterium]|nr:hypothetical protein [Burkholderiaceae bacterium]
MNLALTEEQALLSASARSVLEKEHDFQDRRRRALSGEVADPTLWHLFAEMGWLGLPLPHPRLHGPGAQDPPLPRRDRGL